MSSEHYGAQYSFVFFRPANVALPNANIEKLGKDSAPSRALRRRTAKQCRRKHLLVSWQRAHLPTLSIRTSEALVNRPLGCEAIGRAVSSMSAVVSISSATPSYPTGAIHSFLLLDPMREALLKPFYALSLWGGSELCQGLSA